MEWILRQVEASLQKALVPLITAMISFVAAGCWRAMSGAFATRRPVDQDRSVVIVGTSGVGKSSLVNAMAGTDFRVGGGAIGVTFTRQIARASYKGKTYRLVDTAGLDEPVNGLVGAEEALRRAKELVEELSGKLRLLVMVVKMGTILERDVENYKMFCQAITGGQVPIVIAVTHCETAANMESWARENRGYFEKLGLQCEALVPVYSGRQNQRNPLYRPEVLEEMRSDSTARLWTATHSHSARPPIDFVARNGGLLGILEKIASFLIKAAPLLAQMTPVLLRLVGKV